MAKTAEAELKKMLEADSKTRASQYSSYYTDMGWQRWDVSAAVVAQRIAEEKLQFQEASDMYQKELAALEKRKGDLQKRLADISIKKATAQIKREDAEWKERNIRLREEYKAKSKQVRDDAYVASSSYSHSWSQSNGTGSGAKVRAAGGRDALDEAMDEVGADQGLTAKQAVSAAAAGATDYKTAAAQLKDIKARQKSGQIDNTEYGAAVTLYAAHRYMVSKLAQQQGISEDAARTLLDTELSDGEIQGDVVRGAQKVKDRAEKGSGSADRESLSSSNSASRGSYYKDYELPAMGALTAQDTDLKPLDDAEAAVREQIKAVEDKVIPKPVLEPIDIITATRDEYMQKFGEAPTGTTLRMGGETIGKYKNLMPYELTNALGKVKTFFGNYIEEEVRLAKKAAFDAGQAFTTDIFNAAVEEGKKRARTVLFSGLAARDPQYAAATSTKTAVAGATSAAANVVAPSDERGWDSVGVVKPNTGNAAADAAAYQVSKEAWAATQGIKPQDLQVVKDRIATYNKEAVPNEEVAKLISDYRIARDSGILPYLDDIPEGAPLPDTSGLRAPIVAESEYAKLFRDRVMPPAPTAESPNVDIRGMLDAQRQRIESDDLRKRSMQGERRAPAIEVKPEGVIGPTPTPEARRSIGDVLLRGFRPELDRRTGELITPQMSGPDRAEAIAGITRGGLNQYENFPESMRPPYPREVGGEVFRPMSASEFPGYKDKLPPKLNKLDRAALGIPETPVGDIMGSEVLGGDMGAGDRARQESLRKKQELQDQLDSFKSRREFMKKAGEIGKPEEGASLEKKDVTAKTLAILSGTKLATENPAAAGKLVNKDAMGKYIAALYDENKIKGQKAKPLGELTQTIIREYAGTPEKQKKAVEILSSLAALDSTSGKINA